MTLKNIDIFPVTPLQQGMLFNSIANPRTGVEIEQIIITVSEKTDLELFKNAWLTVFSRHDIFKVCFKYDENGEIIQQFVTESVLPIDTISYEAKDSTEQSIDFALFLQQDRLNDFNLKQAPLSRLSIFIFSPQIIKCVWTFHHAILDGRAFSVLLNEIFDYYEKFEQHEIVEKDQPVSFKNYLKWLNERDFSKDESYWKNFLNGFNTPTQLTFPVPGNNSSNVLNIASEEIKLQEQLSSQLRNFAIENGLSLNTLIHGMWAILLYHYSGESDVVFGSSWTCRYSSVDSAKDIAGLLLNTLPMRITLDTHTTLIDLLKSIRKTHMEMRPFHHTPLKSVHKWSQVPLSEQLFKTLVVFENFSLNSLLQEQGGRWKNREFQYLGKTSFPLTLAGYDSKEIILRLEYYKSSFEQSTIEFILGHIQTLLSNFITYPQTAPTAIPYLTDAEKELILKTWNKTDSEYPRDSTLHELFEKQTAQSPSLTALVFEGKVLSYRELDEKANQIANYLVSAGVKRGTMIGLCVERSFEMVIATIGILKAGAAYVPIDANYPQDRLQFMIKDTQIPILFAHEKLVPQLPAGLTTIVTIDQHSEIWQKPSKELVKVEGSPEDLAYVMYTSGSTGIPKGIEILHRNIVRLVKNTNFVNLDSNEVFLQYAPISFDAATLEIWGPLLNGGKLVICAPGQITPDHLGKIIKENGVTTLWLTAGLFHNIVANNISCLSSLRQLLAGGDVLAPEAVKKVLDTYPGIIVINGYGPTENTTFTTCNQIKSSLEFGATVPIGKAIANTKVYIVDQQLNPVPVGVAGELCTSGDGVGRGYLNRPELTTKAFIENPFLLEKAEKMYRTGDLVRYLPDGKVDFIGRIDGQVKIRGYRIELGEIESHLLKHESVKQVICTVLTDTTGDKKLAAFFIARTPLENHGNILRDYLKDRLPAFMVPQFFVKLDEFPVTSNGKFDRKALKLPDDINASNRKNFIDAVTESEKNMISIWKKVLGLNRISMNDNFFEIGGHSLLAVNLFAKIKDTFECDLPLATIFSAPTPHQLLNIVQPEKLHKKDPQEIVGTFKHIVPINPNGTLPPLFCMHAVGGNVLNYQVFAPPLGQNQPIYGLQSLGIDGITKQYSDIETMASQYITEIQKIQEHGPYYICGGSMGGNIALEVAQQLKNHGEKIALLAMFDTPGPGFLEKKSDSYHGSIFQKIVKSITARSSYYAKFLICNLYHLSKRPIPHGIRYWYVEQMNMIPAYKYTPVEYCGDLVFFTNSLEADKENYKPLQGWDTIIRGNINVIEIPAEHEKFVESPLVGIHLSKVLKKAHQIATDLH